MTGLFQQLSQHEKRVRLGNRLRFCPYLFAEHYRKQRTMSLGIIDGIVLIIPILLITDLWRKGNNKRP